MRVIALEGINGAGKSSIGARICHDLAARGLSCSLIDPAAFGPIGQLVRKRIVAPGVATNADLDAGLYAALRVEGVRKLLDSTDDRRDTTILLERWSLALSAYGTADGADSKLISELRQVLANTLAVDLTILLDITGDLGLLRLGGDGTRTRFESRNKLDSVAHWYRYFAQQEDKTSVTNACGDVDSTFAQVRKTLVSVWPDLWA